MASPADVVRLRSIGPDEILEERYPTDELLMALLDEAGSVRRAAGMLWEERVAQTARLVNIREGSSQREMQQKFQHATELAARYLGHEFMASERRPARVHRIERD